MSARYLPLTDEVRYVQLCAPNFKLIQHDWLVWQDCIDITSHEYLDHLHQSGKSWA